LFDGVSDVRGQAGSNNLEAAHREHSNAVSSLSTVYRKHTSLEKFLAPESRSGHYFACRGRQTDFALRFRREDLHKVKTQIRHLNLQIEIAPDFWLSK